MIPIFNRMVWVAAGAAAVLAGCGTGLRVGGAPEVAVRNCIDAAAREWKVPTGGIVADRGTSPRDGLYAVNLRGGPQGRNAVCSVDENGAVMGVVTKRPE